MKDSNDQQVKKFKEAAKQAETDNSPEAFDRALKKVATPKKRSQRTVKSDDN